ncbi:peroxiredoxin family protein [Tundrisphaera lichenicola]|uniref:peroxiredoxin family protein n=1 Tax=Tundrisphaera lichenicola TaxID=2029860 RepID=UPI003EBE0D3C
MNALTKMIASFGLALGLMPAASAIAGTPRVGQVPTDFTLQTPAGESVQLSQLTDQGPVVLVVLRGWPGYQCPICTKQVAELVGKSKELTAAKARVVLVYPGPSASLKEHAEDFARGKSLPDNFHFVIDPDYTFTNSYGLRWEAPGETAYPSTFVIDSKGKVAFAKTSRSHGDRARVTDVIKTLGVR